MFSHIYIYTHSKHVQKCAPYVQKRFQGTKRPQPVVGARARAQQRLGKGFLFRYPLRVPEAGIPVQISITGAVKLNARNAPKPSTVVFLAGRWGLSVFCLCDPCGELVEFRSFFG